MSAPRTDRLRYAVSALLLVLIASSEVLAGVLVTGSNGISATGVDGVQYAGTSGISATGVDGRLAFQPNGISATGVDGIAATGVDGAGYQGSNGITATGVDGVTFDRVDGITATGVDGVVVTAGDGTVYGVDSVVIKESNGITATGVDGITATGVDGYERTSPTSFEMVRADGITATGVDGFAVANAAGITATGVDGSTFEINPAGATFSGVDGITATGVDGITATGVDGITATGVDGITATGVDEGPGLRSVDPDLALTLSSMADDSSVNAVVVYHSATTAADVENLVSIGILAGTRYQALPMIALTATKVQIVAVSQLPAVRSIYGVRTLDALAADSSRADTGVTRARNDGDLGAVTSGVGPTGEGVTVAVLDTGVDGLHPDLAGRVVHNFKLIDPQGAGAGFLPPPAPMEMANTDLVHGHGTFVSGIIAGNGVSSAGRHVGVAPQANILGLSAGDLSLISVLAGFDYLLAHGAESNVRVLNCSFSANTVFDVNDPVNVATRMLVEDGITVVVSAGNTGSGWNTMNPYAVAPWVLGVGATDGPRELASYSSRGVFASSLFAPKLVAPGTHVTGLRTASAPSITGVLGIETDLTRFLPTELPYYTTASGTSFSAPQVAGVVAMMLQVNPSLTPGNIHDILQRSATPMPRYYRHEVGAGMLNAHAAVLEAAFAARRAGQFRATLDVGTVRFERDEIAFGGTVMPNSGYEAPIAIPADTLQASIQIAWGPLVTASDLRLEALDAGGVVRASSNALNVPGLTGRRESVTLVDPPAGSWRARATHTVGVASTPQAMFGYAELARVEYAPLSDIAGLSSTARDDVRRSLRGYLMQSKGSKFRPDWSVTRADLAATMVRAGRTPQYLAAQPVFGDVHDRTTRLWVESARGLFTNGAGSSFAPNAPATRLVAAIALVRAAGRGAEADSRAGDPLLNVSDRLSIPSAYRGYVAIALQMGLLELRNGSFQPSAPLTRVDLAHAAVMLAGE